VLYCAASNERHAGAFTVRLFSASLVAVLLAWFITSSLWIYPHSLSYFNESIGGPLNGPEHLLGSNVDWGQDLRYLKLWMSGYDNAIRDSFLGLDGAYSSVASAVGLINSSSLAPHSRNCIFSVNNFHGRADMRGAVRQAAINAVVTRPESLAVRAKRIAGYSYVAFERGRP
jgi:hypothetical protein